MVTNMSILFVLNRIYFHECLRTKGKIQANIVFLHVHESELLLFGPAARHVLDTTIVVNLVYLKPLFKIQWWPWPCLFVRWSGWG